MYKMKEAIVNRACRWIPKEKMEIAKVEISTCQRITVFKKLKGKVITKDKDEALKISHGTKM